MEAREDAKLLYALQNDNFFMDEITPKKIIEETQRDATLQSIMKHIHDGSRPTSPELKHFRKIFDELTISDSGLLLRGHLVILPTALRSETIKKAHCKGHFGSSGFKRQMRNHFDFPDLDRLVEKEVSNLCAANEKQKQKRTWSRRQIAHCHAAQIVVNELIFKLLCSYRRENQA